VSIRFRTICAAAALAPLALLAACGSSGSTSGSSGSATASATASAASGSGSTTLSETGSTLLFPLFGAWQAAYATTVPAVTITSGGTGSGTGIADAATGTVTIGASDAYLSAAQLAQYKGLINIPLAVAAVNVNYNVPGVTKPINLNGKVLAQIYSGKITTWNNAAITALNPGVTLPNLKIVTLHRADSSGSTFLFTSYLNDQDPTDWSSSNVGTTITWPSAPGSLAETGSGGMVSGCGSTKGCIAYIGISYAAKATAASLGTAALANKAGKFVSASTASINAALATFSGSTPKTGAQSLIDTTAPTGYPIINYEYAIVKTTQPSAATAAALKAFLKWTITTGASATYLGAVGFEPLPANVTTIAQNEISSISS
jgi:phosphate transport system substrate-binding protein